MLTGSWKLSLFWPNLVFKLLPFDFLQSIKILCPTTMQGRSYKWLSRRRTTSKWQVYHHYVVLNSNRIWLWLMWVEKNKKLGISQSQQEGWRTRLSVTYLEKTTAHITHRTDLLRKLISTLSSVYWSYHCKPQYSENDHSHTDSWLSASLGPEGSNSILGVGTCGWQNF